ncbi:hypothetical protein [Botrimarina mediterranea]|uniref:hypothetical protein n=1 Tax=Botrimarina mediterranea TaxID=2528022 RepID=UPI0011AB22A5|nr:hypothetical protein [Botrimarina mediterranea]
METKNEELSPRLQRVKWPVLTMVAIAAGIVFSQWLGAVWRGPQPAEKAAVEPQQKAAEVSEPSTP